MKPTVYNYLSITEGLQRWTFHVQLIIIDGVSSILIDDVSSILFDEVSSESILYFCCIKQNLQIPWSRSFFNIIKYNLKVTYKINFEEKIWRAVVITKVSWRNKRHILKFNFSKISVCIWRKYLRMEIETIQMQTRGKRFLDRSSFLIRQ